MAAGALGLFASASHAADGLTLAVKGGFLNVTPITNRIVRVQFTRTTDEAESDQSLILPYKPLLPSQWGLQSKPNEWILTTSDLKISINRTTSSVTFFDSKGKLLAQEADDGRRLGDAQSRLMQKWVRQPGEAIYGVSVHPYGQMDFAGVGIEFGNSRMDQSGPFYFSNLGYGILWNTNSAKTFGDPVRFEPIPRELLSEKRNGNQQAESTLFREGARFGIHLSGETLAEHPLNWNGLLTAPATGEYMFRVQTNGMSRLFLMNRRLVDIQSNGSNGLTSIARIHLNKGQKVPLRIELQASHSDLKFSLDWAQVSTNSITSIESSSGRSIDYVFCYGSSADQILSGYRQLTGQTALLPAWSYGLSLTECQSSSTLEELLKVKVPVSVVTSSIQSKSASESKDLMHSIHALGAHVLAEPSSMPSKLESVKDKAQFWKSSCVPVLKSGAEGWIIQPRQGSTRSLVQSIFDAQTSALPDRRAIQLVHTDTTGLQAYAAVKTITQGGDSWSDLQHQILTGLNCSLTGNPNWFFDAGTEYKRSSSFISPGEFEDLAMRRLELIPFVPLAGISESTAQTLLGNPDFHPILDSLQANVALRERLRPYTYSLAGLARFQHGTITRPLIMDFPEDSKASKSIDQYMFGPDFLVTPITQSDIRKRMIHLPATDGGWYDFWSDKLHEGGMDEIISTPKAQLPIFIRAGSILPTTESGSETVALTIYAGVSGKFTLYSDDGRSTDYRKGAFEMIPISWDDVKQTLVFGQRKGSYKGMPPTREFSVVFVDSTGRSKETSLKYTGEQTTLRRQLLK